MIERHVLEKSGLVENGPSSLTFDEVFSLVEAHSHIPYEGPRGIQALREQFQGTCLESVFGSFPEGEAITVDALQDRIGYMFIEDKRDWGEAVYVDHRRVYRDVGGELYTDRKYHAEWQQRAHHYRLAAERITHGFPVTDLDEIEVLFSPRMINPREFFLSEDRLDIFAHMLKPAPDKPHDIIYVPGIKIILPPEGSGYFYVHQGQFRVVSADGHGGWTERGVLAFINLHWMEMSFRDVANPRAYDRWASGLLDITYPTVFFDKHISLSGEEEADDAGYSITSALPADLLPPDPTSLIYKDEGYPELTDPPPSGQ